MMSALEVRIMEHVTPRKNVLPREEPMMDLVPPDLVFVALVSCIFKVFTYIGFKITLSF